MVEHRIAAGPQTEESSPSPVGFLVTTSHFSGVVTIICVSAISLFVNCISPMALIRDVFRMTQHQNAPVSSRTWIPSHCKRFPSFRTISDARAFMGALGILSISILCVIGGTTWHFSTHTYIILKSFFWMVEVSGALGGAGARCWSRTRRIDSIATSVLPYRHLSVITTGTSITNSRHQWGLPQLNQMV